jgi:sugar lactone lactonase YvrE
LKAVSYESSKIPVKAAMKALTNVKKQNNKVEEKKMKGKWISTLMLTVGLGLASSLAWAQFPNNPTWTTVLKNVGAMEGLTGDQNGHLYVADRTTNVCNVWKINTNVVPAIVSNVGAVNRVGCQPSGLAFDANEDLFITTGGGGGFIYKLTPNAFAAQADIYAQGVPGANGVAFLGDDLFVTDGTENQGRVWKIGQGGGTCVGAFNNCVEFFRIQPRRNGTDLGGNVALVVPPFGQPEGVGSERYTVPRHTIASVNNLDRQGITANGIAFSHNGRTVYVSDTSRGAIWAAQLKNNGNLDSKTGCDPTFHPNTLCMDSLHTSHPLLEGVDGIALDILGNIWASINEKNAIVVITSLLKRVIEVFQNPPDATTMLRNGDHTTIPPRPMEFPTSPFLSGRKFCTTGADSPRRDNNPSDPGEGSKVTCIDQNLTIPGLPLPIQ